MYNLGASVYFQSQDMRADLLAHKNGYFLGVPVVPLETYQTDSAEIYVDGKKMPFVPMKGSKAGYRQRSLHKRVNEWQIGVARKLGEIWGRASVTSNRRAFVISAGSKPRYGFLGLNATCHDDPLKDAISYGVFTGSKERFRGASVYNRYSTYGNWIAAVCVIDGELGCYSIAQEILATFED